MINGEETLEHSPAAPPWVCLCVCLWKWELAREALLSRGGPVMQTPWNGASVFSAHLRLNVVWGRSPRRWESRAVFARPAVNPSVRFTHRPTNGPAEEANDFQVNQWTVLEKGERIKWPTTATYADEIVLYLYLMGVLLFCLCGTFQTFILGNMTHDFSVNLTHWLDFKGLKCKTGHTNNFLKCLTKSNHQNGTT